MKTLDRAAGHGTRTTAVPWWAAFGAPLVGVPLLVGLLALGSPATPEQGPDATGESAVTLEQVETLEVAPLPVEPGELLLPEAVEWPTATPTSPVLPTRSS